MSRVKKSKPVEKKVNSIEKKWHPSFACLHLMISVGCTDVRRHQVNPLSDALRPSAHPTVSAIFFT
jgi:hypothetical protein